VSTAVSCLLLCPQRESRLTGQAAAGPLYIWVDADGPVVVHVQQRFKDAIGIGPSGSRRR